MQLVKGRLLISATDLNEYLACEHLTQLELARAYGRLGAPTVTDPVRELLRKKGIEHEAAYLERLKAEGRNVVEIGSSASAVAETLEAMRSGAEVVFQAALEHENWRGYADFLFRVDRPSELGDWSYEPSDTKLARSPKPYFLLQLCNYSEHLERIQGTAPEHIHLILGDGRTETYRRAEFDAYYRSVRDQFVREALPGADTYPMPCAHCAVCSWTDQCRARWEADDHLSQVANIRRSQMIRLEEADVTTMTALGAAVPTGVRRVGPSTLRALHEQASLQVFHREAGEHRYLLLPPDGPRRGFALLPPPSEGDIFFDMEGNPYADGGLEYLFGSIVLESGDPRFRDFWAHDRLEEKRAFEAFIDFVMERLQRYPDMHVYHYAPYEPTALKRLMSTYGTREDEVDHLLRNKVLVDLYAVVRQGVRVSQPSYSIKKLEVFYMEAREGDITGGGESVVAYEEWIDSRDPAILESIRRYNEADCISTWKLRDWLVEHAAEARELFGTPEEPPEEEMKPPEPDDERDIAKARLLEGVPEDPGSRTEEEQGRWLLAQMLDWHRREDKPQWWTFFEHATMSADELVDDADCIGRLERDESVPGEPVKRSVIHTFRFPPQEHKIPVGQEAYDPASLKPAGTVVEIDSIAGSLRLKRGLKRASESDPVALMPGPPLNTTVLRKAILRVTQAVVESGIDGPGRYQAVRDLILQRPPRLAGHELGTPISDPRADQVKEALRLAASLEDGTLFIQGPPGSGKTFTASRVIVSLMRAGKRIGVTSSSHKAIHNILRAIEECARAEGFAFAGVQKASDDESAYQGEFIEAVADNAAVEARLGDVQLVAGTAWLIARESLDQALDYLFVDEAGQVSLANAIAMGTSARNLVLIGDPMQLAQPSQGLHPEGAGTSSLEHLLGEGLTVSPEQGLFLAETRRMHPQVCTFISEVMYENRLRSHTGTERQLIEGIGSGLRYVRVEHEANVQVSDEEAEAVRAGIDSLLGLRYNQRNGEPIFLGPANFLVVAPYNAQVRRLRDIVPAGVRCGTVDKFQGQEAAVVFFSMATSSAEELPRTLEFLFSRNRLNVAISRAQCLAVLVASPRLLHVRCKTVEQMRMVNALCRYVELARPLETLMPVPR